jgi:DUF4097 and DUF4098 domain-containing protein YvlB
MKRSISAVLLMLQGLVNVFASLIFLAIPGMISRMAEEAPSFLFSFFGIFFGLFVIVGILQIIAGVGIMSSAHWAWGFGMGVSILGLFSFPIGTVLAVACILILLSSKEEFGVKSGTGVSGESSVNEEWPLVLGTVVVVIGILWVLAAYVRTSYAWAAAFGVIGIALMVMGSVMRIRTRSLVTLGEVFLCVCVFLAFFVSGIRMEDLAVPIMVGGLLLILAYYLSKRRRGAGRFLTALSIAAIIGAACAPLYPESGSVRIGLDDDWNDVGGRGGMGREYTTSDVRYFGGKAMLSIETTGSITVRRWNDSRIKLEYTKRSSDESLLDDIWVDIKESTGELKVMTRTTGSRGWEAVDYYVSVPRSTSDLHLVSNYGDMTLEGVNGTLNARTEYGDIKLVGIDGYSIDIETDYGDMILERVNGDLTAETGYGDMRLSGSGGKSVGLRTGYGDMDIENSSFDNISAQTGYGDIGAALAVMGNVTLVTMYGDVDVRVPDYKDVRVALKTSGGSIDVGIPLVADIVSENEFVGHAGSPIYKIRVEASGGDVSLE